MVHPSLENKQDFMTSQFYMWRCVVAMAHADGMVHEEEKKYLEKIFSNLEKRTTISSEQSNILDADLTEPKDVADLLPHINDPAFRSQVVYFARLLAYKDGELCPSEEKLLKKLHVSVAGDLNMEAIREEVHRNIQSEIILHEIEKDSKRPMTGLTGLIDQLFLHYGFDLMDE